MSFVNWDMTAGDDRPSAHAQTMLMQTHAVTLLYVVSDFF